jgi:hypothetical protein
MRQRRSTAGRRRRKPAFRSNQGKFFYRETVKVPDTSYQKPHDVHPRHQKTNCNENKVTSKKFLLALDSLDTGNRMKIAALQFDSQLGKVEDNIAYANKLLEGAFGAGESHGKVDIVVLVIAHM